MKLFNRKSKNQIIGELQNEVKFLQSRVDNAEEYFMSINELTDKIEKQVDEIKAITEDDKQQHKVQMLEFTVQSLVLRLINQNLDRINARYKMGDK